MHLVCKGACASKPMLLWNFGKDVARPTTLHHLCMYHMSSEADCGRISVLGRLGQTQNPSKSMTSTNRMKKMDTRLHLLALRLPWQDGIIDVHHCCCIKAVISSAAPRFLCPFCRPGRSLGTCQYTSYVPRKYSSN